MSIRTTVPLQDLINDPHVLEKAVREETVSLEQFLADPQGTLKRAQSKQVVIADQLGHFVILAIEPTSLKLDAQDPATQQNPDATQSTSGSQQKTE